MLKKLFIHEWRSFWKLPAFMCLFSLVYALIGSLTFQTDLWNSDNEIIQLILIFGTIGYFIVLIAPAIVLVLYSGLRFYRNLYTDEGYLMHTLPVKKWELITAKGLSAVIWTFITSITTCLAVIIVILLISISTKYGGISWNDLKEGFSIVQRELPGIIQQIFGMPFWLVCLVFLGAFVISAFYNVLMIYASISIGQLWKKHPLAGTVFSYIGFYFVISFITSLFSLNELMSDSSFYLFETTATESYALVGDYLKSSLANGVLLNLVGIVLFYAITERIMSRKLNLD